MDAEFSRFYRRSVLYAVIKSIAFSLSLGLACASVLVILVKRGVPVFEFLPLQDFLGDSAPYIAAILSGVLLSILGFVSIFFLLKPSRKGVARRMDDELGLEERVQTMLEFSSSGSGVARLQREDTRRMLSSIPTGKIGFGRIWVMIVVCFLSVTLLFSSLLVPVLASPPPEEEIVDEYEKNWRIASLLALIERVEKDGYASADVKDELINEINLLIDIIRETDKEAVMKSSAVSTVGRVDGITKRYITALSYASALQAVSNEDIAKLAKPLMEFNDLDFAEELEDITGSFGKDTVSEDAAAFLDVFGACLSAVTESPAPRLGELLSAFVASLRTVADGLGSKDDVDDAVGELNYYLYEALLAESDNYKLISVVRAELISIFSLTAEDFAGTDIRPPEGSGDASEQPETEKNDDIKPGAGYGKGDKVVGTNDTVYDPERDESVGLADVLDKYYSRYDSAIDGIDEDLREDADGYFGDLSTPKEFQ